MLNGALVIEMVKQFFSCKEEKLWSFDKARNILIKYIYIYIYMGSEKYIFTRFCYISKLFRSAKE